VDIVCPLDSQVLVLTSVQLLRICAGPTARKFPRVQINATKALAAALNNYAMLFHSFEAAKEALQCSNALPLSERNMHVDYVTAYSAWQVARLTSERDRALRNDRGRQAHKMAMDALEKAIHQNDQTFISLTHEILRKVEEDFPELAADLQSAALGTGRDSASD